ncbi:hypothetical protein MCAP1_002692 [Malassezia caprae]|uniref:Major facilitator superfamily (MFS) profile domain-containing protein n=1 Tax=Malassezia caprae TaxID=1381934 RepID=A0AAF0EA49_9BASI|nr:hypothetical protein MCAP1_002692 [Malassezia caprae]
MSLLPWPALWAAMILWVAMATFQFGFGISELNALHSRFVGAVATRECLGLTDVQYGYATAIYTCGGGLASMIMIPLPMYVHVGRRTCLNAATTLALLGSLLLACSTRLPLVLCARLLQGLGAGVAVVQVPLYLQELAPPSIAGTIGICNQLATVAGILVAQAVGTWAVLGHHAWQRVPQVSAVVAALQLAFGLSYAVESPGWLDAHSAVPGVPARAAEAVRARLGLDYGALPQHTSRDNQRASSLSLEQGLRTVALTQAAQQLSGVNAIMYYSTGILSALLPSMAPFVGLVITMINAAMTLPPLWLVDDPRFGRKRLLLLSATGMGVFSLVLAYALAYAHAWLSGIAIVLMIACFSVGLGPVPFVLIPEVMPPAHVTTGSAMGLGLNWVLNLCVALSFQPLRRLLGALDGHTGGMVFVVLGGLNLGFAVAMHRMYTPI